uniref:Peptidyl-prolyl cis-trans isomerase FKBP16-4ic-like isoform X2 n=1 Tax=Rhizophora mucronata TaxID=61149 RepID=A0A2P2LM67_RHIMU
MERSLFHCYQHSPVLFHKPLPSLPITRRRPPIRKATFFACRCSMVSSDEVTKEPTSVPFHHEGRRALLASLLTTAVGTYVCDVTEAVSTSRRAVSSFRLLGARALDCLEVQRYQRVNTLPFQVA